MSIDLPRELLAVNHKQTLEFFFLGLKDVSDGDVDQLELMYNASVLAHHAQVSTQAAFDVPTPAHLGVVFDRFVWDDCLRVDSSTMEVVAAQCLLLAGFFEDQMRRRHNIRWYSELGAGFFFRAARSQESGKKARLLRNLAKNFEPWRSRHARLARELRDQSFLLSLPKPIQE